MKIYVDLDILRIVELPGYTEAAELDGRIGDSLPLEIRFLRDGAVVDPGSSVSIGFAIKTAAPFDALLALVTSFTRSGTGATTAFTGVLNLGTETIASVMTATARYEARAEVRLIVGSFTQTTAASKFVIADGLFDAGDATPIFIPGRGQPNGVAPLDENAKVPLSYIPTDEIQIILRQGTNSERQAVVFANGEPAWATDTKKLYVGDGTTAGGISVGGLAGDGSNFVIVGVTADPVANGTALLAAYDAAAELLPNGSALSATNRAAVILPPAVYDLSGEELVLSAQFVDLIGLTTNRAAQVITSNVGTAASGTVRQTVDGIRVENLTVRNTNTVYAGTYDVNNPCAFYQALETPNSLYANCKFWGSYDYENDLGSFAMAYGINNAGTYVDCEARGYSAFGANGEAKGSYTRCIFREPKDATGTRTHGEAFGSPGASGTFVDCSVTSLDGAIDDVVVDCFGGHGTASGRFERCRCGDVGFGRTASGVFIDCEGGQACFGLNVASGTFERCKTNYGLAFGASGVMSGKFYYCRIALAGAPFGTVSGGGLTRYCIDGDNVANNQG